MKRRTDRPRPFSQLRGHYRHSTTVGPPFHLVQLPRQRLEQAPTRRRDAAPQHHQLRVQDVVQRPNRASQHSHRFQPYTAGLHVAPGMRRHQFAGAAKSTTSSAPARCVHRPYPRDCPESGSHPTDRRDSGRDDRDDRHARSYPGESGHRRIPPRPPPFPGSADKPRAGPVPRPRTLLRATPRARRSATAPARRVRDAGSSRTRQSRKPPRHAGNRTSVTRRQSRGAHKPIAASWPNSSSKASTIRPTAVAHAGTSCSSSPSRVASVRRLNTRPESASRQTALICVPPKSMPPKTAMPVPQS